MKYIRQATIEDLPRIAEIVIFNYRLNFYPIFQDDEFYFKDEVKSIIKRYHGDKSDKMTDSEIEMIVAEIKKELKCFNRCIGE